jgi:hypothetical protein
MYIVSPEFRNIGPTNYTTGIQQSVSPEHLTYDFLGPQGRLCPTNFRVESRMVLNTVPIHLLQDLGVHCLTIQYSRKIRRLPHHPSQCPAQAKWSSRRPDELDQQIFTGGDQRKRCPRVSRPPPCSRVQACCVHPQYLSGSFDAQSLSGTPASTLILTLFITLRLFSVSPSLCITGVRPKLHKLRFGAKGSKALEYHIYS